MKTRECSREREVVAAVAHGVLEESIREHARQCDECAQTVAIARALGELNENVDAKRADADSRTDNTEASGGKPRLNGR